MALFRFDEPRKLPLLREAAVDFDTGQPILDESGDFRMVTGREAVRVWVWRALQPDQVRFAYSAHTDRYGNQLHLLTGRALPEAESRLAGLLREALLVCPYISGIGRITFRREGASLHAAFTVRTVYGEIPAESEVRI